MSLGALDATERAIALRAELADDMTHAAREIARKGAPPAGHVWVFDSVTFGPRAELAIARNRLVAVTPAAALHRHLGPYALTSTRTGASLAHGPEAAAVAACADFAGRSRLVRACERCDPGAMAEARALLVAHGMVVS